MNFTEDWFSHNIPTWQAVLPQRGISRALEVGSHEGRSAVWLMENILSKEKGSSSLTCVDPWWDEEVYLMFFDNTRAYHNVRKFRERSATALAKMIAAFGERFDFIYIDGSHAAQDVLTDLCLGFELLKHDGLMVCDDYLGGEWENPLDQPKVAIDAFVNCNMRRVRVLPVSGYQAFIERVR